MRFQKYPDTCGRGLSLKYFEKKFMVFDRKKEFILRLQHAAFENGHTKESINFMINSSIDVSKLHIIRQKKDCTFRWYTSHPLISYQLSKI